MLSVCYGIIVSCSVAMNRGGPRQPLGAEDPNSMTIAQVKVQQTRG